MTFDDYQQSALRTANRSLSTDERLLDAAAGLAEESGEVLGLVRKQLFQHRETNRARFVEELGDALWCLAVTADTLGVSLAEVAESNVEKLSRRHPDGFGTDRAR
jgi:NTP pyrophosphatase (non-canonical NTP hydrolase)